MITETHTFPTQPQAIQHGETFKASLGWGYDPSYRVYYEEPTGVWVCVTTHARSCD